MAHPDREPLGPNRCTTRKQTASHAVVVLMLLLLAVPPTPAAAQTATTETLTVWANDADGSTTLMTLDAEATYLITATGTYQWDNANYPASEGDAECSTRVEHRSGLPISPAMPGWQRHRFDFIFLDFAVENLATGFVPPLITGDQYDPDPLDDPIDLYVDNRNMEWIPGAFPGVASVGFGCDTESHTYHTLYSPAQNGKLQLRIYDIQYLDNAGSVTATVERLDPSRLPLTLGAHVESLNLNTRLAFDVSSQTALASGEKYVLLAHGMFIYDATEFTFQSLADAECSRDPTGYYNVFDPNSVQEAVDRTLWKPDRHPGIDLQVNLSDIEWEPLSKSPLGCDKATYYTHEMNGTGSPLRITLKDDYPSVGNQGNNTGGLTVDVFRLPKPASRTLPRHPAAVLVDPPAASRTVGATHSVSATVLDSEASPVGGTSVNFTVRGVNTASGTATTNGSGVANFSYSGSTAGPDVITAGAAGTLARGTATVVWGVGEPPPVDPIPTVLLLNPLVQNQNVGSTASFTATVLDQFGRPVAGATVDFFASGSNFRSGTSGTSPSGQATFSYSGTNPGGDLVAAMTRTGVAKGAAAVTWIPGIPSANLYLVTLDPPTATIQTGAVHTVTATVRNLSGNAVSGVAVNFTVRGANNASGTSNTNSQGKAVFSYTGTNPGADAIVADASTSVTAKAAAQATWTPPVPGLPPDDSICFSIEISWPVNLGVIRICLP